MYPFTAGIVTQTKELWEELRPALEANAVRVLFELAEVPDNWASFLERIERVRPDVIFLEVSALHEPIEAVVSRIRSTAAQPAVIALHTTADSQAILAALRGGAAEFLCPPLQAPLTSALQRLEQGMKQSGGAAKPVGKTLGFLSVKGGCGATTLSCHVAATLGRLTNEKVLLADLDLQSGLIGFLTKAKNPYSIADAAGNLQRLDPSYWRALISNGVPNLEVIPAPSSPTARDVPAVHLKQVVAFARTLYKNMVVDLGRNLSPTTLALLDVMDEIYLVTTYDVPALHQAKGVVQYLLEHGYAQSRLRLILNRKPKHMDLTFEEIGRMLGIPVYAAILDSPGEIQEAYTQGRLVEPETAVGQAMTNLARKISGVEAVKAKKMSFFGL